MTAAVSGQPDTLQKDAAADSDWVSSAQSLAQVRLGIPADDAHQLSCSHWPCTHAHPATCMYRIAPEVMKLTRSTLLKIHLSNLGADCRFVTLQDAAHVLQENSNSDDVQQSSTATSIEVRQHDSNSSCFVLFNS